MSSVYTIKSTAFGGAIKIATDDTTTPNPRYSVNETGTLVAPATAFQSYSYGLCWSEATATVIYPNAGKATLGVTTFQPIVPSENLLFGSKVAYHDRFVAFAAADGVHCWVFDESWVPVGKQPFDDNNIIESPLPGINFGKTIQIAGQRMFIGSDAGIYFYTFSYGGNYWQPRGLIPATHSFSTDGRTLAAYRPATVAGQVNAGTVDVWNYLNGTWQLTDTLTPPTPTENRRYGEQSVYRDGLLLLGGSQASLLKGRMGDFATVWEETKPGNFGRLVALWDNIFAVASDTEVFIYEIQSGVVVPSINPSVQITATAIDFSYYLYANSATGLYKF